MKLLSSLPEKNKRMVASLPLRLLFILHFSVFIFHSSVAQSLSPDARVSLVTVGPGQELYSSFGHSVLWISDPATGIDKAYNYGTFNFHTENFYIKFMRGTLPYQLSAGPLMPQVYYWQTENRTVKQQLLNMTPAQKDRLYQFLEHNFLPENREYQYKFFYDNCSSRLQDAIIAACGDSLYYPGYIHDTLSFRQWIDRYAHTQKPWADFGMDLAIGAPSDEIATPMQATFLPNNLSAAYDDSRVLINGQTLPLVANTIDLYTAVPVEEEDSWLTPQVFFWVLAGLVLLFTMWQMKYNKLNFLFDKILFTIVGLTGWLIVLLWFGTDHGVTAWNYDILWAFPLWFPFIFSISKTNKPAWFQFALIGYAVLLLMATGNLLKHNYVVIPILVTLIIRVYYMNNSLSKIPQKKAA